MSLNARPHLNGNSPDDFRGAARALTGAAAALEPVLAEMRAEITHPRNYQHLPPEAAAGAQMADRDRLEALARARAEITALDDEIAEILADT